MKSPAYSFTTEQEANIDVFVEGTSLEFGYSIRATCDGEPCDIDPDTAREALSRHLGEIFTGELFRQSWTEHGNQYRTTQGVWTTLQANACVEYPGGVTRVGFAVYQGNRIAISVMVNPIEAPAKDAGSAHWAEWCRQLDADTKQMTARAHRCALLLAEEGA